MQDEMNDLQETYTDPNPGDLVRVVRCCKCVYWDRESLRHQFNDFRDWNEAECSRFIERDPWHDGNWYMEADDYCSYGERKDG